MSATDSSKPADDAQYLEQYFDWALATMRPKQTDGPMRCLKKHLETAIFIHMSNYISRIEDGDETAGPWHVLFYPTGVVTTKTLLQKRHKDSKRIYDRVAPVWVNGSLYGDLCKLLDNQSKGFKNIVNRIENTDCMSEAFNEVRILWSDIYESVESSTDIGSRMIDLYERVNVSLNKSGCFLQESPDEEGNYVYVSISSGSVFYVWVPDAMIRLHCYEYLKDFQSRLASRSKQDYERERTTEFDSPICDENAHQETNSSEKESASPDWEEVSRKIPDTEPHDTKRKLFSETLHDKFRDASNARSSDSESDNVSEDVAMRENEEADESLYSPEKVFQSYANDPDAFDPKPAEHQTESEMPEDSANKTSQDESKHAQNAGEKEKSTDSQKDESLKHAQHSVDTEDTTEGRSQEKTKQPDYEDTTVKMSTESTGQTQRTSEGNDDNIRQKRKTDIQDNENIEQTPAAADENGENSRQQRTTQNNRGEHGEQKPATDNEEDENIDQTQATDNEEDENIDQTQAADNDDDENIDQTQAADNDDDENIDQTQAADDDDDENIDQTQAADDDDDENVRKTRSESDDENVEQTHTPDEENVKQTHSANGESHEHVEQKHTSDDENSNPTRTADGESHENVEQKHTLDDENSKPAHPADNASDKNVETPLATKGDGNVTTTDGDSADNARPSQEIGNETNESNEQTGSTDDKSNESEENNSQADSSSDESYEDDEQMHPPDNEFDVALAGFRSDVAKCRKRLIKLGEQTASLKREVRKLIREHSEALDAKLNNLAHAVMLEVRSYLRMFQNPDAGGSSRNETGAEELSSKLGSQETHRQENQEQSADGNSNSSSGTDANPLPQENANVNIDKSHVGVDTNPLPHEHSEQSAEDTQSRVDSGVETREVKSSRQKRDACPEQNAEEVKSSLHHGSNKGSKESSDVPTQASQKPPNTSGEENVPLSTKENVPLSTKENVPLSTKENAQKGTAENLQDQSALPKNPSISPENVDFKTFEHKNASEKDFSKMKTKDCDSPLPSDQYLKENRETETSGIGSASSAMSEDTPESDETDTLKPEPHVPKKVTKKSKANDVPQEPLTSQSYPSPPKSKHSCVPESATHSSSSQEIPPPTKISSAMPSSQPAVSRDMPKSSETEKVHSSAPQVSSAPPSSSENVSPSAESLTRSSSPDINPLSSVPFGKDPSSPTVDHGQAASPMDNNQTSTDHSSESNLHEEIAELKLVVKAIQDQVSYLTGLMTALHKDLIITKDKIVDSLALFGNQTEEDA